MTKSLGQIFHEAAYPQKTKLALWDFAPSGGKLICERGYRNWKTVTGNCKTAELAMSKAALKMDGMLRGRVLFVIRSGYYAPQVSMEWRQ